MAGRPRAANLPSMNESTTSHTLVLRLWLDRECLHGSVTTESGSRREFAGRLGLIGATDDLLTRPGEPGAAPPSAVLNPKEPS